jgi:signal transduction histidine kinase
MEAQARLRFAPGEGVTGHVAETGEPAMVEDTRHDPRRHAERREIHRTILEEGIRSVMHLPIKVGSEVFGIFSVCFSEPHAFGRDEVRLFLALAERAARAIENAQLFVAEQRRAEQFRVISEVGRRITSIQPVDELLEQMARLIREAFGYYLVVIGLVEGDKLIFHVGDGALWDDPDFLFEPIQLRVGQEGITGLVASTGQPHLVPDVSKESSYVWLPGSETRSELAVPIKARGEVIGVLDVESDQVNAFDESDSLLLQSIAHQAAIALENARLYERAQQLAVVEERSRLARDLHDAVTQTLFSASLIAETLPTLWENDQEEGQALLRDLRQLSRGALAEMRTLLLELRPAALAEASMHDLLHQLGEAVTGRTGVPVAVSVGGSCALPVEVHVALYRIAQEALNNVVKHAHASEVKVDLQCDGFSAGAAAGAEQSVRLRVSDNGCGFDPLDVPPDHLGLGIIRERAQSIGAAVDIQSKPGQGTEIVALWTAPLQTDNPHYSGKGAA